MRETERETETERDRRDGKSKQILSRRFRKILLVLLEKRDVIILKDSSRYIRS